MEHQATKFKCLNIIIIQLRYGVSSSSIYTTKILHLTSPCIAANLINLIRPT
jgi:hypothetical protein